jgi:hypothetical protein
MPRVTARPGGHNHVFVPAPLFRVTVHAFEIELPGKLFELVCDFRTEPVHISDPEGNLVSWLRSCDFHYLLYPDVAVKWLTLVSIWEIQNRRGLPQSL